MTKAVCPGSFDPVTNGHVDIFTRAAKSFEEVIVLVTANPNKQSGLFNIEERMDMIRQATSHIPNITVAHGVGCWWTTPRQTMWVPW